MKRKKKNQIKNKKKNVNKKRKSNKTKRRVKFFILNFVIIFCIFLFIAASGFCIYIIKSAPEFDLNQMFEKEASRLYDADGNIFATLGTEKREKITFNEIPNVLIDAIIATEDSRFFQHNGFDLPRFMKASIQQVIGGSGGGASTITMQLSKISFTSTVSTGMQGIIRKFTDIYMSVFKIERNLTKEQIIEYYVNTPCLGGNIYGVEQASKFYFGKRAKDLNLVEAAMIAGLFQSPNGYNPYINPEDANERKNTVLYLMKRHGYITDDEYKIATKVHIKNLLAHNSSTVNEYQGFIDTVVQEVINDTKNNPYDVPMDIYTTMVRGKQDIINDFYKTYKFLDDKIEIGVGAIDVKTGAIIAVGAGRDKKSAMTLNVATFDGQIKRQAGSTIKPLIDYGPAFEYANLSTYGPFLDEPTPYGRGTMRNFVNSYTGLKNTSDCLAQSINTCALQAFMLTTDEDKKTFIKSLGIDDILIDGRKFNFDKDSFPQSYSIGAFNGVSPVQLAGAYAAFASGGYYTKPYSYTKVVYIESEEEVNKDVTRTRVMSEQTAYLVTTILRRATSWRMKVPGSHIATKTGTTSYDTNILRNFGLSSNVIPDSWTSSYSPDYALAIWYGYPDTLTKETVANGWYLKNSHANLERLNIQALIGNKFYEPNSRFPNVSGIVSAEVELGTIPPESPSEFTPDNLRGTFLFKSGTAPSNVSNRFSKLRDVSNVTYSINNKQLTVKFTSPGTPAAIDTTYLREYFTNGYTHWAEKYYNERIAYNNTYIGEFGFEIYLTSGVSTKYLGWTKDTTFTYDLNSITTPYDGVLIKSSYSKFKYNASDGIKISFDSGDISDFDETKIKVTVANTNITLKKGTQFNELNTYSVTSIKYDLNEILLSVTNMSMITNSVKKDDDNSWVGAPGDITETTGNYTITYSLSFVYSNRTINKTITQKVKVID